MVLTILCGRQEEPDSYSSQDDIRQCSGVKIWDLTWILVTLLKANASRSLRGVLASLLFDELVGGPSIEWASWTAFLGLIIRWAVLSAHLESKVFPYFSGASNAFSQGMCQIFISRLCISAKETEAQGSERSCSRGNRWSNLDLRIPKPVIAPVCGLSLKLSRRSDFLRDVRARACRVATSVDPQVLSLDPTWLQNGDKIHLYYLRPGRITLPAPSFHWKRSQKAATFSVFLSQRFQIKSHMRMSFRI